MAFASWLRAASSRALTAGRSSRAVCIMLVTTGKAPLGAVTRD
jgi:hypothetical protein